MTYFSSWRSPSNIALVKYWGKYGIQLPRNPSLSFTLSACYTEMKLEVTPETDSSQLVVLYDGLAKPGFEQKIKSFFSQILNTFPWLKNASVVIHSHNTFPFGSGIASSASSMSALALCLSDLDDQMNGRSRQEDMSWLRNISQIARVGSGSACRSVFPVAALWGDVEIVSQSSNTHAVPWAEHIHPFYQDYQDTILLVSAEEKSVSSSEGHELMTNLPYADVRYAEAKKNIARLIDCMQTDKGIDQFISICETEALQLHAMMMSGKHPFILLAPETISIIKEVWQFRKVTGIPVCFTLDAGPNVHLLYPFSFKESVLSWVNRELAPYCSKGRYILDRVGNGPEKINYSNPDSSKFLPI